MSTAHQPRRTTLSTFRSLRSPYAFWFTTHLNYRTAAWLAWGCHNIGLTPNQVSWLSLIITLSGPAILGWFGPVSDTVGALTILFCTQAGYTLDCTDGTLARATGQGSRFGQLLDKVIDTAVMLLLPALLYFPARNRQGGELFGEDGVLAITFFAITVRGLMATLSWLKEYVERDGDRVVKDARARNLGYYVRRGIGTSTDTSLFYLILGAAWAGGWYWTWMAAYSCWLALVWAGYLALTYRDLRSV